MEAVVADVTVPASLASAVAGSRVVVFAASSRRKTTSVRCDAIFVNGCRVHMHTFYHEYLLIRNWNMAVHRTDEI